MTEKIYQPQINKISCIDDFVCYFNKCAKKANSLYFEDDMLCAKFQQFSESTKKEVIELFRENNWEIKYKFVEISKYEILNKISFRYVV